MVLTFFDLILTPIYLLLIFFVANYVQKKHIRKQPLYKWYTKGLMVKLFGALLVCFIYQFYYTDGGDTVNYFISGRAIANLLTKDYRVFLDLVIWGNNSAENFSFFDLSTDWPVYWRDPKAFFVSRLVAPLVLLSFNSFTVSAILLAWISYSGIWKIFLIFNEEFPMLQKQFAISILFIPSVFFWGSGLMKDTFTLSAIGWYTYYFCKFFINKNYEISSLVYLFLASFVLVSIKPYILFALLPGSIIWITNQRVARIKNTFFRTIAMPFFLFLGGALGYLALNAMHDFLGEFALENVAIKAVVSNLDQKQTYYGGSSFDIGEFEADPISMLSKAHLAIAATLFRPYLWDVRNPVMLISALENTYILVLTIFLLIKLKVIGFVALISRNPLLLFSILFSLFFAFSVGIATSNFGSLVRLKIPCIPFFMASLFVLKYLYERDSKRKLGI